MAMAVLPQVSTQLSPKLLQINWRSLKPDLIQQCELAVWGSSGHHKVSWMFCSLAGRCVLQDFTLTQPGNHCL